MPLQETLDTFSYFISEADNLPLAFFELVRYAEQYDVEYDGKLSFPFIKFASVLYL